MFVFLEDCVKELHDAIMADGYGIGSDIVKVDMFLNHRLDTKLLNAMGREFYNYFKSKNVDTILTIEASGIALAIATATAFGEIPVVFAKKHPHEELDKIKEKGEDYTASVYSFTHKNNNVITVKKRYLEKGSNVLVIDDFLANGEAAEGMINILKQAECKVAGIGIGVEKGFQPGGKHLRNFGYDVKSLAIIDAIDNGNLVLANDN
ncbi:MAG: xanthine phosphoribosyltransferase [Christensenellaceae bacterium]|nr:xanthine phosphoribosyltransferase [Christensenellaceae bacterium]